MCAGVANAQRAVYELFGADHGLTNLSITAWAQDKRGYVWVGTERGLFRFDGTQFRRYGEQDGLPHELVMGLGVGPDGTLWVSTFGGLAWRRSERFERPGNAMLNGPLAAQGVAFAQGKAYFATHMGVVYGDWPPDQSGLKVSLLPTPEGRRDRVAKALAVEPSGTVWWGCGKGLCQFDGRRLRKLGPAEGVPDDDYYSILIDRSRYVWARSRRQLLTLAPGGARFEAVDSQWVGPTLVGYAQIASDPDGRLLVGTTKGLAVRDQDGWSLLNANNGLPVSGVSGAWTDREGALWIGLSGAGLVRMPGYSEWTSYSQPDGLAGDIVAGLAQTSDGRIWLATTAGLSVGVKSARQWRWSTVSTPGLDVLSNISLVWDGSLLVAGTGPHVLRLMPGTNQWIRYGPLSGNAYGAVLDKLDRVWVASDRGLFRSDSSGSTLERLDETVPAPGDDKPRITFTGLSLGRGDEELWISTYNGLLHYLNGRWKWLQTTDGLRSKALTAPSVGPDGSVWVGYRDVGGASRIAYRRGRYTVESIEGANGLGMDVMYTFHFPAGGAVWSLTSNGVQVLSKGKWIRLDRSDGLLWDECSEGAFLGAGDGSYWIGTSRGVSRFAPRSALKPPKPPQAIITEARLGGRLIGSAAEANARADARTVQIRFAVLEFRHAASNRFRYRVDGRDWVETSDRSLSLEQLSAGRHSVEVKAGNPESGWSGTARSIEFHIAPRWYELWWIRLLIAALSLAMVLLIWQLRNRRLESARKALERAVELRTEQLRLEKQKVEEQHTQIGQLLQKAIEANRLKSEFLANMSHEIRTPMNAILGMMSLTLESDLDEKQREQLDGARSAAVSLLGMLTDILDLSKIEAGRLELSSAPFDLHALFSSVHALYSHEAEVKGLEAQVQIAPNVPVWVQGDKDRLRQVLINLMSNAVKFTEAGHVSISAQAGPLRDGSQEITIIVEDTGIGIAEKHKDLVFEGFRQADGSITRRYGGTGLGLAITWKLLHAMGGRIEMESQPGRGSRFTVTLALPVVGRPAPVAKTPVAVGLAKEKLRVLVAEDNLLNQKVAQRVLEKRGHEVVVASTGLFALDAMARQDFDVVVMDLQMPVMDGIEATRRLRREGGPASTVPVLGFTASALPEDREACIAAGMNGLVNKPVEPHYFVTEVERLGRLRSNADDKEDG